MKNNPRGTQYKNSHIKFKNTMLKWSLCDYSDAYILVKRTITVVGQGADAAALAADRNNKQINWTPITDCVHEINKTHNHFHNILRHFDVLPNFPFPTSETKGNY